LPFFAHKKAAKKTFAEFKKELKSNKWYLIILDEINVAINFKLLNKKEVISAISSFPEDKILILTGRDVPKEFIKIADLVTEMKEIKHPFLKGKQGKIAVEF